MHERRKEVKAVRISKDYKPKSNTILRDNFKKDVYIDDPAVKYVKKQRQISDEDNTDRSLLVKLYNQSQSPFAEYYLKEILDEDKKRGKTE